MSVRRAARSFPTREALQGLLRPRGIAVVGASADHRKFSGRIISALQSSDYPGGIYPVNPRYAEIGALPCYPNLAAVPGPCDLAIIAVRATLVPAAVRDAAARGLGFAIIMSAGFDEATDPGPELARELAAAAGPMRLYGPNCPGLWQIRDGLVYTFSSQFDPAALRPGPIGLVSQGGAMGRAVLDAMALGLGFSYWFSTGNEADLECSDFVAFLADDPGTTVVAVILEGFADGRRFLAAAERCRAANKPVVVLKVGQSPAGARAASRHTAAGNGLPGLTAACLQAAGCLQVDDLDELIDLAGLLARFPKAPTGGLGVCTFSGGAGVLLADLATAAGLELPAPAPATAAALAALLPAIATVGNPTDLTTAALEDAHLASRAVEIMAADPGYGAVVFPFPHRLDAFDPLMAAALAAAAPGLPRPLVTILHSPLGPTSEAAAILAGAGVPVFRSARQAVTALRRWQGLGDARWHGLDLTAGDPAPDAVARLLAQWGLPLTRAASDGPAPGRPPFLCLVVDDQAFGPAVGVQGHTAAWRLAPLAPGAAEALAAEAGVPAAAAPTLAALADLAASGQVPAQGLCLHLTQGPPGPRAVDVRLARHGRDAR